MQELASKYDILKVVGHGGFSAVFKARSKEDPGHVVALKQLDFVLENEDAKEYRDFKNEVEILKRLDHPNIVKIYDEYILDNKPSLEMEYVDGETLESIIQREGYFSIEDTLEMITQMASALSYCHHYHTYDSPPQHWLSDSVIINRDAIIHNDINPKNIIRTKNEDGSCRYVLIDFGLSFADPDAVRHSKKEDGMAEYKAPEKWRGQLVDTPSDIYSLGIVIYELLAGQVPFPVKDYKQANEMLALEEKHKSAPVPDICRKRMEAIEKKEGQRPEECDIPAWLEMLVRRCLEKNPLNRFKTGRELSQFFYNGLDGKIETPQQHTAVIDIDPAIPGKNAGAYIEVEPNILTEGQHFFINKDLVTIGRWNDLPGATADFGIRTSDRFISKNHCQILRKPDATDGYAYFLQDKAPSKNGTFFNSEKNSIRLSDTTEVLLKDGDYFWIGNTRLIFHAQ
ncbi:FHA domain-containing serine/threonine-protein kinase [Niabella sp. CC-SYL272]|uniref:FHA domain-containing serine/threonine-protein kinase n=1 Tax=Niabella agricola TaxID=2891571 RepID=UPI001F3BC85C|nr:FHA domain-containing serine/threonine-protein kinase [Niabella agricola]MCF3108461.1 FHA domain-containing serine/threonine-protein kinase [Niabella agricola]